MTHSIRTLNFNDRNALSVLSYAIGWEQSPETCGNILEQAAGYCLGVEYDGRLAGCAAGMRYPDSDVAFLFEIIVHPEFQRRGIARTLLAEVMRLLENCPTLRLYGTPAGEPIYAQAGFRPYGKLGRYFCRTWRQAPAPVPGLQPMQPNDLTGVVDFDRENFGVARQALLDNLYCHNPGGAFVIRRNGRLEGFVLTRADEPAAGKRNISTLQAHTPEDALALLQAAGCTPDGGMTLIIDIFDGNDAIIDFILRNEGKKITPMTAMQFGVPLPPPSPAYIAPVGADIG